MGVSQSIVAVGGVRLSGFITIGGRVPGGGGGGPGTDTNAAVLAFGANFPNLASQGRYTATNGESSTANRSTLDERSQATVPISGTSLIFSWSTEGATALTVMKIWANGLVVDTITLTGLSGLLVRPVPLNAGDLLAVEYDAGIPPRDGNYSVTVKS